MAVASRVEAGPAVEWLLASDEPAIAALARRDLLDEDVRPSLAELRRGPLVRGLLAGQQRDGGFGADVYGKWGGAHWRLVSLVELGVPPGEPPLLAALETVLAWLTGPGTPEPDSDDRRPHPALRLAGGQRARGRVPARARRRRTRRAARALARGVAVARRRRNCDKRASGRRSSFHESLSPLWGLHEYAEATGAAWAREAADRTAELFLEHGLFRSLHTGEPVHPTWLVAHYPPFWHYDVPQALLILARAGYVRDRSRSRKRSTCSSGCDAPTAAGRPAAAGGGPRAATARTSRSSTGGGGRARC